MTTLLKKAFEQATQLPDVEQNALAKWLLDNGGHRELSCTRYRRRWLSCVGGMSGRGSQARPMSRFM